MRGKRGFRLVGVGVPFSSLFFVYGESFRFLGGMGCCCLLVVMVFLLNFYSSSEKDQIFYFG